MIRSFRCQETRAIYEGYGSRKFRGIEEQARNAGAGWTPPRASPIWGAIRGNRLEALKGDPAGQYSIRINPLAGLLLWCDGSADDVEIVD